MYYSNDDSLVVAEPTVEEPMILPIKLKQARKSKLGANERCPCGSGRKYKKCCKQRVENGMNLLRVQDHQIQENQETLFAARTKDVHTFEQKHVGHIFLCPACNAGHFFTKKEGSYAFNGNYELPSFEPSLRVVNKDTGTECHSLIQNGTIRYLADSQHALVNQKLKLPPIWLAEKSKWPEPYTPPPHVLGEGGKTQ